MQLGQGAWQGSRPLASCLSCSRCVSPAVGECHPWSVCAAGAVPGLGHLPGRPQARSPAFAILLWPLAVKVVTVCSPRGPCPWAWGEWSWGIRVSQPPCSCLLLDRTTAPAPGSLWGRGKQDLGTWGVVWSSMPAHLPARGRLQPFRARNNLQRQEESPRGCQLTGGALGAQAGCRQVPQQVPHHPAGGGEVTLEWSWQTLCRCGAQAAAAAGHLPCPQL